MKKQFFNPEFNTVDMYEEVWIVEKINVKDEKNLLVKIIIGEINLENCGLILIILWKMFIEVLKLIEQEKNKKRIFIED